VTVPQRLSVLSVEDRPGLETRDPNLPQDEQRLAVSIAHSTKPSLVPETEIVPWRRTQMSLAGFHSVSLIALELRDLPGACSDAA